MAGNQEIYGHIMVSDRVRDAPGDFRKSALRFQNNHKFPTALFRAASERFYRISYGIVSAKCNWAQI